MSLVFQSLKRCKSLPCRVQQLSSSTAALPVISGVRAKRTSVDDPNLRDGITRLTDIQLISVGCRVGEPPVHHTKHSDDHVGLFYTIPEPIKKQLFSTGGLPKPFFANTQTFSECCLMVRSPAVELIRRLNETDFSKPAVRYVLYGRPGCGKSLTLAHLLHYASVNKFVILHVPWTWNWFRRDWTEVVYSSGDKNFVDLPVMAAQWLKHFQTQNPDFDALNLQTSKEYVWSQREQTPAGSPLSALILHGINRVKFAAGCVSALINEVKLACNQNKCKAFVAVDGFNALVGDYPTRLKTEDRIKVRTGMVTMSHAFQEATKQDWKNASIVVTVDQLAAMHLSLESHWPIYLLGRQGFEHLDPFVPVNVTEYTDLELNSALDYYEDRMWLQRTEGRNELGFLSNKNPYALMTILSGL